MPFSLVANSTGQAISGSYSTASVNSTGANLAVVGVSQDKNVADTAISDSNGNTYTQIRSQNCLYTKGRMLYCSNPTVGSGHTVTDANNSGYQITNVQFWSGAAASSTLDQQNSAFEDVDSSTFNSGTVTPTEDNELVVTSIHQGPLNYVPANAAFTIVSSSFTAITDQYCLTASVCWGGALGYKVQTTAASISPTWHWVTSEVCDKSGITATFKAAVTATGVKRLLLLGVG